MDYIKEIKAGNGLVIMDLKGVHVFIGYSQSPMGGSCLDCYRFSYKECIGKSPLQLVEECWIQYKEERKRKLHKEIQQGIFKGLVLY